MENNLNNIPSHGFAIVSQSTDRVRTMVETFVAGSITLSPFSIIQILEGAEHLPEIKDEAKSMISRDLFKVYVKLNGAFRRITLNVVPEAVEFEINRVELLIMIKMLKARMAHCESERDQRTMIAFPEGGEHEKFSADTYIGQKLLLLELLTLAMGTIVD